MHKRMLMGIAVALMATVLLASPAGAGVYTGYTTLAGSQPCRTAVSQSSSASTLGTATVRFFYSGGTTEDVAFVPVSTTGAEAAATHATVRANVSSNTATVFRITSTSSVRSLLAVRILDTGGSQLGFDLAQPSPGTPGSQSGTNLAPITISGAWNATAVLSGAVQLSCSTTSGPANDLYLSLRVGFSTPFVLGNVFAFRIDTDRVT